MLHSCKVWAAAMVLASAGVLLSAGDAWAQASKFTAKPIELKLKDGKVSYPGELADTDDMAFNRYYKLFTVELEKGKTYRIDHRDRGDDAKFDPYLMLEDAKGKQIEFDDDGGGDLNARLVFKAPGTGTYRIIALTLPVRQTGKFSLEIAPASAAESKLADLKYRIRTLPDSTPAQRQNLVQDFTKTLKEKGDGLTPPDAQLAMQLSSAMETTDKDLAKGMLTDFVKIFGSSSNEKVASMTRQFEHSIWKIDIHGKRFDVTGKTIDDKDFDLKKLKGKVVLVDFWATWCGPCIAEIPNMKKAYDKYHDKGFEIIGVSRDRNDDVMVKFQEKRKLPWTSINVEDSAKLADAVKLVFIPLPILVDQEGRVVSFNARGPELEQQLEKLLGGRK